MTEQVRGRVLNALRRVVAVIPARLDARRLPRKPLVDLGGEPLVWRVYEAVVRSGVADVVLVAADCAEVAQAVRARGGEAVEITGPCASGTQRVARAAAGLEADIILNVQGDEPFVDADLLAPLVARIREGAPIATLAGRLPVEQRADPAAVKVVRDSQGHALYFSRAPIPGDLHLGLYAFTPRALAAIADLPRGPLAAAEDLEQLAWLWAGWTIAVASAPRATLSVDTPADLARARQLFSPPGYCGTTP